ncbi:hypothetical protein GCM10010191_45070 [Actinomadura vinacea]|uniref:Uncharacterized protein n=1 Tax=Actinomadura vinacea TaxID=115336 RepID=A0ABP5WKA1_9ACTN
MEARRALAREFPNWSIIHARDTGRWWALRRPDVEPGWRGNDVTEIIADAPEQLRAKLREIDSPEPSPAEPCACVAQIGAGACLGRCTQPDPDETGVGSGT